MVIAFDLNLTTVLERIIFTSKYDFFVQQGTKDINIEPDVVETRYRDAKWQIAELINNKYISYLVRPVDPYNWLFFRCDDEVSYFVCEMGANVLHHSGCKWPERFEVYTGEKGFVISVCQAGSGFDAVIVNSLKQFSQSGGGFTFLRACSGSVFFDDPHVTKIVYYAFFLPTCNLV